MAAPERARTHLPRKKPIRMWPCLHGVPECSTALARYRGRPSREEVPLGANRKKLYINLGRTKLKEDKTLRLIKKYGILKVPHHILLKKSLEKKVVLMRLLKTIPLAMRHKDFYMEKAKVKTLVVG